MFSLHGADYLLDVSSIDWNCLVQRASKTCSRSLVCNKIHFKVDLKKKKNRVLAEQRTNADKRIERIEKKIFFFSLSFQFFTIQYLYSFRLQFKKHWMHSNTFYLLLHREIERLNSNNEVERKSTTKSR